MNIGVHYIRKKDLKHTNLNVGFGVLYILNFNTLVKMGRFLHLDLSSGLLYNLINLIK